jgi:hypothetical protein
VKLKEVILELPNFMIGFDYRNVKLPDYGKIRGTK